MPYADWKRTLVAYTFQHAVTTVQEQGVFLENLIDQDIILDAGELVGFGEVVDLLPPWVEKIVRFWPPEGVNQVESVVTGTSSTFL